MVGITPILMAAGGLAGYFGAKEQAKSQQETNRANIASQEKQQETALQAFTGTTPFKTVGRDLTGGFTEDFGPAGRSAAETREIQTRGDVGRARGVNEAITNFRPSIPNLGAASGIIRGEEAARQSAYDEARNVAITGARQQKGFQGNTALQLALDRQMQDFALKNTAFGPRQAAELYSGQGTQDQALLAAIVKNLQPQGPQAPGFTSTLPGAAAAQAVAQTPPAARIADPSGSLPYASIGTTIGQALQYRALGDQQKQREALIDRLIKSKVDFKPTINIPT